MAIQTRLGLSGTPGRPYAAWQAKTEFSSTPFTASGVYQWVQRYFLKSDQVYTRRASRLYFKRSKGTGDL